MNRERGARQINFVPAQLYKDSLAFRLLRMHGHSVSPCMNLIFQSYCNRLNIYKFTDKSSVNICREFLLVSSS